MPIIALAVPQTDITVTRTVVQGVIQDLIHLIGLSADTDIVISEDLGQPATSGGTVDPTPLVNLTNENRFSVSYRETPTDAGILTGALYREEYPYLFSDPDIGLNIRPTYGMSRIEMNITLQFRNKSDLTRFKRLLRLRGGINAFLGEHAVRYDYSLPDALLSLINDSHVLRESVAPYGEDLTTYLNRCFLGGLMSRRTQDDTKHRLVLNEQQEKILGFFSEEIFYTETTSDREGNSATFTYRFDYNQILGFVTHYPNMIHNQRLPKLYRTNWDCHPPRISHPITVLSYMPNYGTAGVSCYYKADGGMRVDIRDEWYPKGAYPVTGTVVITPIVVDVNDPKAVLNINDFTAEMLPLDIRRSLIRYRTVCMDLYQSPYIIQGFNVGRGEKQMTLTLEADGRLHSAIDLDPRERHFLRIATMLDISKLSTNFVYPMLKNPVEVLAMFTRLTSKVVMHDRRTPLVKGAINIATVGVTYLNGTIVEGTVAGKSVTTVGNLVYDILTGDTLGTVLEGMVTLTDGGEVTLVASRRGTVVQFSYHAAVKLIPSTNKPYSSLIETRPSHVMGGVVSTRDKDLYGQPNIHFTNRH